ncbi:DEAD-box ATP-dependent RNA helicase CshA [compost metagenome]
MSLVVNFDVLHDPEDYIHRIGRTARAATTGTAITLVNDKDKRKFASIEKLIDKKIDRMPLPEHLGEAPADTPASPSTEKKYDKKKPQRKFWKKKPKAAGATGPAKE